MAKESRGERTRSQALSTDKRESPVIERVQTGIRIEKRLLKVLKGIAEYADITLGDLVEGIVLHAFEGKSPFDEKAIEGIEKLKDVYGLTLTTADSHKLVERGNKTEGD